MTALARRSSARIPNAQLSLGDGAGFPPHLTTRPIVEGETWQPSPQYHRLFGALPPDQVINTSPMSESLGGQPGVPSLGLPISDPSGLPAAEHFFSAALIDVASLRACHLRKGHTPEADAALGWLHFKRLSDEVYREAVHACKPETRRKRLIIAAAILVAQIDAEDFLAQKEPTP